MIDFMPKYNHNHQRMITPKQPSMVITTSHYYKAVMMEYGISHFYGFKVEEDVDDIIVIVPDGCVDFLFHCDDSHPYANIIGTRLKASSMEGKKGDLFFGVRFLPGKVILPPSVSIAELVEGEVPLLEVMKSERVFDKIVTSTDFRYQYKTFLDFYVNINRKDLEHLNDRNLHNFLLEEIEAASGNISVEGLSRKAGYSVRYVNKVFKNQLGIPPKTFCRITRFQSFLNKLKWEEDEKGILDIAMDAGYYDQSHMIREFQQFTNSSPLRYIKRMEDAEYKSRLIVFSDSTLR